MARQSLSSVSGRATSPEPHLIATEIPLPHRDQDTITPAGGHEGGKPKNLRYLVGGMIVIFLLGMAIVGASTKVLQRPGPDQRATEKAPAD